MYAKVAMVGKWFDFTDLTPTFFENMSGKYQTKQKPSFFISIPES